MSVCSVTLCKDEADVIEPLVRHLFVHVDEAIIADNLSTDGTYEILMHLTSEFGDRLTVVRDEEIGYYQARKTTELARRALERGHRWVVPVDADEVWITSDGRPIRDWLDGIGREIVFVKAAIYNHCCTALDPAEVTNPFLRIGWHQRTHLDMRWGKVACRLRPDLEIHQGNHSASTLGTGTTGGGLEIRHFPYRSPEHFVKKALNGIAAYEAATELEGHGDHWRSYGNHVRVGGKKAGYEWFHEHFYSSDPENDQSLVYNPAPLAGVPDIEEILATEEE